SKISRAMTASLSIAGEGSRCEGCSSCAAPNFGGQQSEGDGRTVLQPVSRVENGATVSYDPFKDPVPRTKPRANEKLWELFKGHDIYACEMKYHGECGVEAQIFKNAELLVGSRTQ